MAEPYGSDLVLMPHAAKWTQVDGQRYSRLIGAAGVESGLREFLIHDDAVTGTVFVTARTVRSPAEDEAALLALVPKHLRDNVSFHSRPGAVINPLRDRGVSPAP